MLNITGRNAQERIEVELEKLGRLAGEISPSVPLAIQALLAARDCEDPVSVCAHLDAAHESLREHLHDAIQKQLGRPQLVRESWRKIWEAVTGCPSESFDELGKGLESVFNTLLSSLLDLRDGPVRLLEAHGYEVDNAPQLKRDIAELATMKENLFQNWPWSHLPLPPVNRKMVEESRAAIASKEGERIEDLIRRLGGVPSQGV